MRTRTSLITSSVAFVCVVGVVGKSAVAMEETPSSSLNLQHYNAMLNSMGFDEPAPEKRAYTYVSEYKRLPVYNFGIGKRWIDNSDDKVSSSSCPTLDCVSIGLSREPSLSKTASDK